MSVSDKIKEGANFIREEFNEKTGDPVDAQIARNERNEARIAQGKAPLTGTPGDGSNA